MAKQPNWTKNELERLEELLDKHTSYDETSKELNRSIKGIKIAISYKLHYWPLCLGCGKRIVRKGRKLRCEECVIEHNKKMKRAYSQRRSKYFKNLRNELRFGGNRQKTLERDKYVCRICFKNHHQIILDVHHKDNSGRNKKIHNNSLENLITLCHSCHTKYHKTKKGDDSA